MPEVGEILCAKCKVPLEGPTDPEPQSSFTCPICRESDTLENIREEAEAYFQEEMAKQFQQSISSGVRGQKWLKFEPKRIKQRVYRFIVQL